MADLTWQPRLTTKKGPRYRAIADALEADIAAGRLTPGTRLPTHRALADVLGVTVGTITRAYTDAERRGLIDATVGRGTYVRSQQRGSLAGSAEPTDTSICFPALSPAWTETPATSITASPPPAANPDRATGEAIDLSANYPVGTYLADALAPGLAAINVPERLNAIAGYQSSAGHPEHRVAGADWLGRFKLPARPEEIIIANGCQGGMSIALAGLTHPGETVLVEDLAWPGIHALTQQQGLRPVAVPLDRDGLRPDALAEAAQRSNARIAYCMPTHHNPTNRTMPESRRREILNVAATYGMTIIEDDIYGFLHPDAPPPLAALAPDHAVYTTSLSKCVAPGLRIGFVKAPANLHPRIIAAQRAACIMACSVTAELATYLIQNDHADHAATRQRAAAEARQRLAARYLPEAAMLTHPSSFHIWLKLPERWSGAAFVRAAWIRGVAVTPGDAFTPDGRDPRGVRLCLCAPRDERDLERALSTLAGLLAEPSIAAMPFV